MLKKIKALFEGSDSVKQTSDADIQLAAATLMFEMIRSDGVVDDVELEQMRSVLGQHFALNHEDVEALLLDAKDSAEDAISLQGFTRKICENWNNPQRLKLLEYLWMLALSDQRIDAHERHFVRKIAGLIYLTDREINSAKNAAQKSLSAKDEQ